MDSTVPNISFNKYGMCNYCTNYLNRLSEIKYNDKNNREFLLKKTLNKIKIKERKKQYDCIVGISGGLDSSYLLYIIKKLGLRPLAVHLDNGWNSELAVSNIEKLVKKLDVDLYTYVIDWEEFKNLQIAFFKANVIDIEMLTDHAIIATLYKVALQNKVNFIIAGTNIASEGIPLPQGWNHFKFDLTNIKYINKKFGSGNKIRSFPTINLIQYFKYRYINRIEWVSLLDYIDYVKDNAIKELSSMDWRPYDKKHYESVFTRFYQGYILPHKFNVDKRKLHYSTLICSSQISRKEALRLMKKQTYDDESALKIDKDFVLKKLGINEKQFEEYIKTPPIPHNKYLSNKKIYKIVRGMIKLI